MSQEQKHHKTVLIERDRISTPELFGTVKLWKLWSRNPFCGLRLLADIHLSLNRQKFGIRGNKARTVFNLEELKKISVFEWIARVLWPEFGMGGWGISWGRSWWRRRSVWAAAPPTWRSSSPAESPCPPSTPHRWLLWKNTTIDSESDENFILNWSLVPKSSSAWAKKLFLSTFSTSFKNS